jgi:hypothetical protein
MNQHALLTALDNWQPYESPNGFHYTAELISKAAAEIRRLSPLQAAPLTDEETSAVLDVFGRTDSEAEAGL